jgi:RAB protein geranylgeranyltransferase component A
MLVYTDVTRYLDFKLIDGSYVFKKGGGIHKVPATEKEAISTGLVGLLQKNWLRGFLKYMAKYKQSDPKTWDGTDLTKVTMKQFYDKMWLDAETQVRCMTGRGLKRPAPLVRLPLSLCNPTRLPTPCRTLWATPWRCTATTRT